MAESDEVWRRVEANERIARRYLNEHEPHYPKFLELPCTDWHYVSEDTGLIPKGANRCGSRAREETNDSGPYAPGFYSFIEVECARPRGHAGDHVSSCRKVPFIPRWKIVSWPQRAPE